MHWTFRDCEYDASEMRGLAKVSEHSRLTAREIGEAAGVKFTRKVVSGCVGEVDLLGLRVYANSRGKPCTRNFDDAHELQHIVRGLAGEEFPHDEDRVDWAAIALTMPAVQVREVLRSVSLDRPQALIAAFPLTPPLLVLLRVAWVIGRPVALHRGGRWVWAPEDYSVPEPSREELSIVREARHTLATVRVFSGMVATPIGSTGAEGVMVALPDAPSGGW